MQAGDKRWAALLALDVVGFSGLTQSLGEEKVYALLQEVLQLAERAVTAHGGHVVDTAGDGVLAGFGAPQAVENASLQACRAADQIMTDLAGRSDALARVYGVAPEVRIGLAGGMVMVAAEPGAVKLVGDPVNMAARLQALAAPNTTLMTDAVAREVAGFVATEAGEAVSLKGFETPVAVHRLGEVIAVATRFDGLRGRGLGAFVSRETEVTRALAVFAPGLDETALMLSGVAGIGKSRLLYEVSQSLAVVHVGQCGPDLTGRPFAPVEQIIAAIAGLGEGATRSAQFAAVRQVVPDCCDEDGVAAFTAPRAGEQDPAGRLLNDRDFLLRFLTRVVAATGAVLVVEDTHWADLATLDLLEALIAEGVALILTTRDGGQFASVPGLLHLALQPMGDAEIGAIFAARATAALSPALAARVVDQAEGIPLVAEEIAYAIAAGDQLVETPEGLDLKDPDSPVFSGNLQQLVLSRVDRLPPEEKQALQVASAIGRDFGWDLLEHVLGGAAPQVAQFDGIIEARDARTGRFSHALIREAVYSGLLSGQRMDIHGRIADGLAAETEPPGAAVLAYHYVAADQREKAAQALIRAAEEALQVYDIAQVDRHTRQVFVFLDDDPALIDDVAFADVAQTWMRAKAVGAHYKEILAMAADILPRLAAMEYVPQSAFVRAIVALAHSGAREYAQARDLALETIAEAEAHGDAHGAGFVKSTLARIYEETGWAPQQEVRALCRDAIAAADHAGDRHLGMTARYMTVASFRDCGRRLEALEMANEIEAFGDVHQDRRARGYANWARAIVHGIGGDAEAAGEIARRAKQDILRQSSDSLVLEGVECFAHVYTGDLAEVRARLQALRQISADNWDYNLVHSADWIATVLELRAGNLAAGWKMADETLAAFRKAGNVNIVRQALMMRGEVALAIAGLIDPDAEAPPGRPKPVRGKPTMADILTFLKFRLFGMRGAERDLAEAAEIDHEKRGAHYARVQIGLGLIALKRRKWDRARDHLVCGLDHARDEGVEVLVARAEAGLAALS